MSRAINFARKALKPTFFNSTMAPIAVSFQSQKSALLFKNSRFFGTEVAHDSHSHGKDEPFLDPNVVTERIIEVIKNFEKVDASKIGKLTRFKEDLDLDSLDAVEVVMAIEEEFSIEIPDSEADKILSIPDAVHFVSNHPMAK